MPLLYPDGVVQTAFTEISATTSITSTTYVDLLTLTITTGANPVIAYCSMCSDNTTSRGWVEVQITIDGVAVAGMAYHSVSSGNGNNGSMVYKSAALTAGSHTFKVQWHVGAALGGTASITPSGNFNHATFYLEEVTV